MGQMGDRRPSGAGVDTTTEMAVAMQGTVPGSSSIRTSLQLTSDLFVAGRDLLKRPSRETGCWAGSTLSAFVSLTHRWHTSSTSSSTNVHTLSVSLRDT